MTPTEFFYEHAGYSYDPAKETADQGRERCARELAKAEAYARRAGIEFSWEVDRDCLSSDWLDPSEDGGRDNSPWYTWICTAYDESGSAMASLGGVDFGRDGSPHGDPYGRVVEAELAAECMDADDVRAEQESNYLRGLGV
jgi:hypothetical protein